MLKPLIVIDRTNPIGFASGMAKARFDSPACAPLTIGLKSVSKFNVSPYFRVVVADERRVTVCDAELTPKVTVELVTDPNGLTTTT